VCAGTCTAVQPRAHLPSMVLASRMSPQAPLNAASANVTPPADWPHMYRLVQRPAEGASAAAALLTRRESCVHECVFVCVCVR
jgi:hypothetical protein